MFFLNKNRHNRISFIFDKNREVKALPKYFSLIAALHFSTLLVPEFLWAYLGLDASKYITYSPQFLQYYVSNVTYQNAMFIFWLTSPFALTINTYLFVKKVNTVDYSDFLVRRKNILVSQGQSWNSFLFISCLIFILGYTWVTFIDWHSLSTIRWPNPIRNKFAMFLIHGATPSFVMPIMLAVILTEIRVLLTTPKINGS